MKKIGSNPPSQPRPTTPSPPIEQEAQKGNPIFEKIINEMFAERKTIEYRNQIPPQQDFRIKEANNYYYIGIFKKGLFHEKGLLIMIIDNPKQIEIYDGQFKKGVAEGYGEFKIYGKEYKYIGGFENNLFNSEKGQEVQKDFEYVGSFVDGIKKGYGEFTRKESNRTLKFKGFMKDDQMESGTLEIFNQNNQAIMIYKGKFSNGQMEDKNAEVIDLVKNESKFSWKRIYYKIKLNIDRKMATWPINSQLIFIQKNQSFFVLFNPFISNLLLNDQ
ncbi:hypothetical protein pb186bvf_005081 [Paramecium bursaria]